MRLLPQASARSSHKCIGAGSLVRYRHRATVGIDDSPAHSCRPPVGHHRQIFLFVNDAVLAVPKLYGIFYGKNQGRAKVTITQQRTCFVCVDERNKPGAIKPVSGRLT